MRVPGLTKGHHMPGEPYGWARRGYDQYGKPAIGPRRHAADGAPGRINALEGGAPWES